MALTPDNEGGWSHVLAFPDQSPSFAHGFICGRIWEAMWSRPTKPVMAMVVSETREAIEAMAMSKGWVEAFEDLGEGWLGLTLTPPAAPPAP